MQQEAEVREGLPGAATAQFRQSSAIRQLWETNSEVFQRDKMALFGLCVFAIFAIVAIFAPQIAPNDPLTPLKNSEGDWIKDALPYWLAQPGVDEAEGYTNTFYLGTTNIGRDIFSQLIHGSRSALLVGFSAAAAVAVIGTVVGLLAGYYGGWVDAILMRAADVAFGIPFIPFIIVVSAFLDPSIWNVVVAMAVLLWRDTGRVIRSQVLVIKEQAFVSAGARLRRQRSAHHLRLHRAKHPAALLPLWLIRHRLGNPDRSERQFSWLQRSGDDQLGLYAARRLQLAGALARGFLLDRAAGAVHHVDGDGRLLHRARLRRSFVPAFAADVKVSIMSILSIRDLKVGYATQDGAVEAVDGVSLDVAEGQRLGLIGESGCGKTTLLNAIVQVLPRNGRVTGGKIMFKGMDLMQLPPAEMRQLRWREIATIPQASMDSLNPVQRVGQPAHKTAEDSRRLRQTSGAAPGG